MKNKQEEIQLFNERYESYIKTVGDDIPNITGEDLNDYWEEGAYQGNNLVNAPNNEFLKIVVIKHSKDWFVQQAMNPAQVMWLRAKRGDGSTEEDITEWKEVDFGDGSEQGKVEVTIIEQPASHPLASKNGHGYMSKTDYVKLYNIDEEANKYIHPEFHSPDIIAQDELNRFTTDKEKEGWDKKADGDHNHDETYASKNHTHRPIELSLEEITNELNLQRKTIELLTEKIDALESGDNSETVSALIERVRSLEMQLSEHTGDIV